MDASTVNTDLDNATIGGIIDLWAASNTIHPLAGVLTLFGITSSYSFPVGQQSLRDNTVTLTGSSTFGQPGATNVNKLPVNITLTFLDDGSADGIFTLTFRFTNNDWLFSTFFLNLPQSRRYVDVNNTLWVDSYLKDVKLNSVSLSANNALNGLLQLTGFLPYNDVFSLYTVVPYWPLRIGGWIKMPASASDFPTMELTALAGPGSDIVMNNSMQLTGDGSVAGNGPSGLKLTKVGLRLSIINGLDPDIWEGRQAFSTLFLVGHMSLGTLEADLTAPLLISETSWTLFVRFGDEHSSLVEGLSQLTTIFGLPSLPIPDNFPLLSLFRFSEIDLYFKLPSKPGGIGSIDNLAVTIISNQKWTPPIPKVAFSNVGVRWVWAWSVYTNEQNQEIPISNVSGTIFGTIEFGDNGPLLLPESPINPDTSPSGIVHIDVNLALPSLFVGAEMRTGDYIDIGSAFNYFLGGNGPLTAPNMNITTLRFNADPIGQRLSANASIIFGKPDDPDPYQGWQIDLVLVQIILQKLNFNVDVWNGSVGGGISAEFMLLQDVDPEDIEQPRMLVSAEYPVNNQANGWTFRGYLFPGTSIDVVKLVKRFLNITSTSAPLSLSISRLDVSFTTGTKAYSFSGTISTRWNPQIFGNTLTIDASASIDISKASATAAVVGTLSGYFSVNKFSLMASMDVGVTEPTYIFKVQFDQVWLLATTSWRGDSNNNTRHQVVSLQLGGVTLGDMLEYFVNLAAPTIGFKLDSPWDVLKKIDLSRFVLTIDPKENAVEFVYNANVDIVVASIKSVGIRYTRNGGGKVNLILTGSFLGQTYTDANPLTWDVVNDPPPSVPGQGIGLVDLRYLGIGQRVSINIDEGYPDTVAETIALLRRYMKPSDSDGNPLDGTGMIYAGGSEWLIGLDMQIMETVDLGFVFNDPRLYGLSIGLTGDRAGSLAGLRFEILYKKITDDIGMFRIELQVPEAFRTIQLGAVSLTLGIIVLEIYTNGNFKIDLGFPYNRDYSRSFTVQVAIFIGRGGFYLGVLNGDTSKQVPRITNGNFSPVIELGIGIAAGVGREIRAGILSGGAYIELEVIFQGVLAWFNPNSSGQASATFFKCQGIAALHGKIYGSVDFVIIKVSVTLEAYAQVSVIYECYKPMLISLSAYVRAEASVSFFFFSIHFSFGVNVEIDFTIGSSQPTPWIVAGAGSNSNTRKINAKLNRIRKLNVLRTEHYAFVRSIQPGSALTTTSDQYLLSWQPSAKVFPDSPRKAHVTLLPMFTVADVPVSWDATPPVNNSPDYRSAFVLLADTGMSPTATTAAQCAVRNAHHSAMATSIGDTSLLAADILVQGLVTYAINALPRDGSQGNSITAGQVELLLEQLKMSDTMSTGLSIANLATFFTTNINLWISGDTSITANTKSGMTLPIPPFIQWTSQQAGNVDFSSKNKIGAAYEWGISQLLNTFLPVGGDNGIEPADDPSTYESFASFMFRDFCLMVMQSAVKEMQGKMTSITVTVGNVSGQPNEVQSLEQIALTLPTATVTYIIQSGDTVGSVGESLGATVEELEFLNSDLDEQLQTNDVGTPIQVKLGIAPEILAIDNASEIFALNQVSLGTVVHQADDGDTLQTIASHFQITAANLSTLLSFSNSDYPDLTSSYNILKAGSKFDLPLRTFTNAPSDFVQARAAAAFFVRYIDLSTTDGTPVPDMANWYAQAIADINQALLNTLFPQQPAPPVLEIPPGQLLTVPSAYNNLATTNQYTTVAGDTLERIGFTLTFQQDYATTSPPNIPWQSFKADVQSAGPNSWNIPAQTGIIVQAGESIQLLVRRLIIDATWSPARLIATTGGWTYNWVNVALWIGQAKILSPLAAITVPGAMTAEDNNLSFSSISTTYGLSITDAAQRLKSVNGLYALGKDLVVNHLPAQDIDLLVSSIMTGDSFTSIVNQASRMLMAGLQLPGLKTVNGHVVEDTTKPLPLYDLTGQQFDIAVDASAPTDTALAVSVSSETSWITLFNSIAVAPGDTLPALETQYPGLLTYNPGLNQTSFHVGMILLTAPVGTTLDYSYTNAAIISNVAGTALSVVPIPPVPPAPVSMKVSGTVPRTYGLEHRIELQTPVQLPIPGSSQSVSGNPGLWMFPSDLLQKATSGVSTLYEILAVRHGSPAGSNAIEVNNGTFGMILPFKLKRMNDSSQSLDLVGVDTDNRNLLLSLETWLRSQVNTTTAAFLAVSPAPNATNTSGLTILSVNANAVSLLKTNLSTASVPPSLRSAAAVSTPNDDVYFANLSSASLADFVQLLWEGSVVGGVGYYFNAGQDLPASAFDQQGNITLQLLIIAGTQQAAADNGRSLLPFNNCAIIGPGTDPTVYSIYIESAGSTDPSETVKQALLPPGNIGFELFTNNPFAPSAAGDQTNPLKRVYSLLAFTISQLTGSPFGSDVCWMPVLPAPSDASTDTAWQRERARRKAIKQLIRESDDVKPYWHYAQVMPVSKFIIAGTPMAGAMVNGLPAPTDDPYLGFGMQSALPTANFVFGFGDILGNRSGSNKTGQGTTPIQVGYTDNVISIGDWPSITRYFSVQASGQNALLTATIAPRPSELLPTPSQRGDVNSDQVTQQQQRFAQIYYQLIQTGISGWLVSSLNYIADPNYGNKGQAIADISPLWKFAAGSYAIAKSLGELIPAKPQGITTLADIVNKYAVSYGDIALANADTYLTELFGSIIPAVPAYIPFIENMSVTTLLDTRIPKGWPTPDAKTTLEEQLNALLPLKTGLALTVPGKSISSGQSIPTPSLQVLANTANTSVSCFAKENATSPILSPGFEFVMDADETTEVVIIVDTNNNSLQQISDSFSTKGIHVSVEDLALLNKDHAGLLIINCSLNYTTYVVKEGDTLAANSSGETEITLATSNTGTANIFNPGALIYLGNFTGINTGNTPVTLKQFADCYACPMDLLLNANSTLNVPSSSELVLPGILAWPDVTTSLNVPYTIQQGDTLTSIAGRFAFTGSTSAALQLATVNEDMPGTIQPNTNVSFNVGGTSYQVNTGSNPSFLSVLTLLQQLAHSATLQDVVNGVGSLLFPGGLFLCPPALFTQTTALNTIATTYGVTSTSFALSNAAMQNIVAAGVSLSVHTSETTVVTVVTGANDTFNTLITRFSKLGVAVGIDDIINANPNAALISANAIALIPPAPINFTVNLGQGGPYLSPITPLQVSIRLIRPEALIYPEFKTSTGTGPVEMSEADVPAPARNSNDDSGLNFNDFVTDLEAALPKLRLGTGKVNGVLQDLWFVNFDSTGIAQVQLSEGMSYDGLQYPRYFGLKPLYRFLVTRKVPIALLNSNGTLDTPKDTSFQSIDVELWARKFFEDVDRFLSGPYAVATYNDSNIQDQLKIVLDAKATLIPKIAQGLGVVLDITGGSDANALASAVETLSQQLGVSLSKTYESTILIQFNSSVNSSWQSQSLKPADLYGQGITYAQDTTDALPGITTIATKTDLSQASSYANFLVTLDNPSAQKNIKCTFNYNISHAEFNIAPNTVQPDYKSSDWLTFMPLLAGAAKPAALSGTDPGKIDIPVPVRIFPALPKILNQVVSQQYTDDGTPTPDDLGLWKYDFIYTHEHLEQDHVLINTEFNLNQLLKTDDVDPDPRDLFTELAKYIAVSGPLWDLLSKLDGTSKTPPDQSVERAVAIFASLVSNVAQYWQARLPQDPSDNNNKDILAGSSFHSFSASANYVNENLDTYTLVNTAGTPGPNGTWCDVYVQLPTGEFEQMLVDKIEGNEKTFKPDPVYGPIPRTTWPVFKLEWTSLNVAAVQNARSGMQVERNQGLLDNPGPSKGKVPTTNDFILTTDFVKSASVVAPLNNFGKRVDITDLGSTLILALTNCFNELFGQNMSGQKVTIKIDYGFELVPPPATGDPKKQGLVTYLPIGLYPNQSLSSNTASALNDIVESWKTGNNPARKGGEWVFSLKLYSQLTAQTQTLLNIEHLVYRLPD